MVEIEKNLSPNNVPQSIEAAVLLKSTQMPSDSVQVQGYDFNSFSSSDPTALSNILKSYLTTGFQATNLALAIEEINNMVQYDRRIG